jgi:hypothetical protein
MGEHQGKIAKTLLENMCTEERRKELINLSLCNIVVTEEDWNVMFTFLLITFWPVPFEI